jgi:hypothetical protein
LELNLLTQTSKSEKTRRRIVAHIENHINSSINNLEINLIKSLSSTAKFNLIQSNF